MVKNNIYENKIGVVILNYLNYWDTLNLLEDLSRQEKVNLKIVVVDNNSPNESFNILKSRVLNYNNVILTKAEYNKGYSAGNNIGIKLLYDCDYISILNADVRIRDKELFFKLLAFYHTLNKVAFISPVIFDNKINIESTLWNLPSLFDDFLAFLFVSRKRKQKYRYFDDNIIVGDCLAGSFLFAHKNIFDQLGGFDEGVFLYNEEAIMGLKVKKMGLNNYLITSLKYYHKESGSINICYDLNRKYGILFKSKLYYWEHKVGLKIWPRILLSIGRLINFILIFIINIIKKVN